MMKVLIFLVTTLTIETCAKQTDNKLFCVRESTDGIDKKVQRSKIVIAGYTRSVYDIEAEFLVFSVIKGEQQLSTLFKNRKLSALETALNRRLVNVTSFARKPSQSECQKTIRVGETYLVFAYLNRILILDGDDGIQLYSKAKEEEIRKLLAKEGGSAEQWGEWSACSRSCGGGIQTRRRKCELITCRATEGSDQQRSCNTFACDGLLDVLEVVGLRQTRLHPADRSTAYRLINKGSWSSTADIPTGFPKQFSLLIAVRALSSPTSGFLLRMLHNDRDMQLAVHFSDDTVSLILPDHSYARFKQEKKLVENVWYWMSFSVRRSTVTFFKDCKPSGVAAVSSLGTTDDLDSEEQVKYVVGSLSNRDRSVFQGDVEQILFAEAPSAAAEQCSVVVEQQPKIVSSTPIPTLLDSSKATNHSRTTSMLKNTKTSKGLDDDFAFSEDGSGEIYDYEYEDEAQDDKPPPDIRKAVLLLSESPAKDDDDDEENEDSYNFLSNGKMDEGREDDEEYEYDDDYDNNDDDIKSEEIGSGLPLDTPEWSDWSECSQTCNWGIRTRSTFCKSNKSNRDGCNSNEKQSEACFLSACPAPTTTTTTTTTTKPSTQKIPAAERHVSRPFWRNSLENALSVHSQPKAPQTFFHIRQTKVTAVEKHHSAQCKLGCRNRGYCNSNGNCICKRGFSGKFCEKATCEGLCENGGTCTKYGRCICLPGYYGFLCEIRKCNFIAVKRPYEKSYKKMIVKEEKYSCGAWGWKKCSRTKVYYAPEFKTFYRTEYVCDSGNEVSV